MCRAACLPCLGLMVAVHLVRMGLSQDWDTWLTLALAFIPARYSGFADVLPGGAGRVGDVVPHAHAGARRLGASRAQRRLARRLRRCCRQSHRVGALPAVLRLLRDRGSCNLPRLQPGPDGADGRRVGRDLRADGRDDALSVHRGRWPRSCRTAGGSALGAADAARASAHRQARRARHRGVSDGEHSWPFSASAASAKAASPGRRISAAISPAF